MVGDLIMRALYGSPIQEAYGGGGGPIPPGGIVGAMTGGAAAGGPPQPQQMPPAQATQSPPDMAKANSALASNPNIVQLYLRQEQLNRAADQFDRGLEGLVLSKTPPAMQSGVIASMSPQPRDAGTEIQNLMTLQSGAMKQNAFMQLMTPNAQGIAPIDTMAQNLGVDPATFRNVAALNPDLITQVIEQNAGITGDPTVREMNRAKQVYMQQNGITNPNDPKIPDEYKYPEKYKAKVATESGIAKDVVADQANFANAKNAYDRMINDTTNLLKMPGLTNIIGPVNSTKTSKLAQESGATKLLDSDTQDALAHYNQIMAQQYGAGVQDFKGAGRITNQELATDMPSQSTMQERGVTEDAFRKNAQDYIEKLETKRAQVFGQAGQLASPDLSDYEYDHLVNPIYKPGGQLFVPNQPERRSQPAVVQSPEDIAKLPKGKAYIVPPGYAQSGQKMYAGY